MLTQRLITNVDEGSGILTVTAGPGGIAELIGLADELNQRSTITTVGQIHVMGDPGENPTPSIT